MYFSLASTCFPPLLSLKELSYKGTVRAVAKLGVHSLGIPMELCEFSRWQMLLEDTVAMGND